MAEQFQWANAISTRSSLETAVNEVAARVRERLSGDPDVAIVTISSAYGSEYPRLVPLLLEKLPVPALIGCGGGGIIGVDADGKAIEVEGNPALSLSVGCLPGVRATPFHISSDRLPDLDSPARDWEALVGVSPEQQPDFILLSEPMTSKANDLLEGLDFAYPQAVKVGGLASSMAMGSPGSLFYHSTQQPGEALYREGTVGLALSGEVVVEAIVAQGCRPVGPQFQVVSGERNVLFEVVALDASGTADGDTVPPLEALRQLVANLGESDRELAQHSLFVGVAMSEFKQELKQGDFLIRNLLGVDPRVGAVAIGDRVRPGQRIQFHLRDANTSAEDLELLLKNYCTERGEGLAPVGALQFSCLGRGKELYGKEHFDAQLFRRYLQQIQVGGFFCNGEIGPVGDRTFLHGYTSVFGIIRRP